MSPRRTAALLGLLALLAPGAGWCASAAPESPACPMAAAMNGSPCDQSAPEPMDCCALSSTPEEQPATVAELAATAWQSQPSQTRPGEAPPAARLVVAAAPPPPSSAERYTLHASLLL